MSIKTEIDRIKQSKADIISALTNKGVTVPSDASIDDLSALVEAIEVGSDPVLQTKSATPSTSSQTISPDSGYDGLSKVTISAVTSSIDSDIKASNIKKGVNILGVTGTLESGITPSGTMSITSNGTYDVTNYASASVNVPSSGGSGGSVETGRLNIVLDTSLVEAENEKIESYYVLYVDKNGTIQVKNLKTSSSIESVLNTPIVIKVQKATRYIDVEFVKTTEVSTSGSFSPFCGETVSASDTCEYVCWITATGGSLTIKQWG